MPRSPGAISPPGQAGRARSPSCTWSIPDRPGVLAQVTTIAGELGVNIEDLEIVHVQDQPRGVLILTVATDAADRVRHALGEHGYGMSGAAERRPVIAIDGPAGAGKSTVATAVARRLGLEHLDTGAMYRAVTLAALRQGVDPGDAEACAAIARSMELRVGDRVDPRRRGCRPSIRQPAVTEAVSTVAAHPAVRAELVERQRAWVAAHGGGVVEGRDIGSVVLPDADLKIFLTADTAERARRRASGGGGPIPRRWPRPPARCAGATGSTRPGRRRPWSPRGRDRGGLDRPQCRVRRRGGALAPVTRPDSIAPPPTRCGAARLPDRRIISVGTSRLYFPGTVAGRENLPAERSLHRRARCTARMSTG